MGSHPINLAIRFLLELTALIAIGMWGYRQSEGGLKYILAFGLPIILASIWGTFAVPNDPSRSGNAPIVILGIIRLLIELVIFAMATWSLYDMGFSKASLVFGIIVALHYITSYDRVIWLISQ